MGWEELSKSFRGERIQDYLYKGTTDVDRFKSGISPFGCHDMAGNVREWCADWYGENNQRMVDDPIKGPESGSRRVVRGGSWGGTARRCRCAYRNSAPPDIRDYGVGFRVAFVPQSVGSSS